jgi:multimeric flavodoxin WrbA
LFVARPDFLTHLGEPLAHRWIRQGVHECGMELGDNILGRALGRPKTMPGSPYGPGTLAGTDGSRQPVEAELTTARNLGSRLARVASRLKDLRVSRAAAP